MKLKNKNYQGFTFLELALVIAIVGIMTSVALVSLNPAREAEKLKISQREVASAIKLTQSFALQGKTQEKSADVYETPMEYGIRFSSDTEYEIYYIFKDSPTTKKTMESLKLPEGVTLKTPSHSVVDVRFTVPHADVSGISSGLTLEFKAPGGTTKTIKIEKGGAITEE